MSEEIKICDRHDNEVPLLWTFRFDGAEYWCPYCGANYGMFGAGIDVELTEDLKNKLIQIRKDTKAFLSYETDEWEYGNE